MHNEFTVTDNNLYEPESPNNGHPADEQASNNKNGHSSDADEVPLESEPLSLSCSTSASSIIAEDRTLEDSGKSIPPIDHLESMEMTIVDTVEVVYEYGKDKYEAIKARAPEKMRTAFDMIERNAEPIIRKAREASPVVVKSVVAIVEGSQATLSRTIAIIPMKKQSSEIVANAYQVFVHSFKQWEEQIAQVLNVVNGHANAPLNTASDAVKEALTRCRSASVKTVRFSVDGLSKAWRHLMTFPVAKNAADQLAPHVTSGMDVVLSKIEHVQASKSYQQLIEPTVRTLQQSSLYTAGKKYYEDAIRTGTPGKGNQISS